MTSLACPLVTHGRETVCIVLSVDDARTVSEALKRCRDTWDLGNLIGVEAASVNTLDANPGKRLRRRKRRR